MPVEVVGRDVEDRGDPRAEAVDRVELKARHLRYDDAVARELERVLGEGRPDVAAHQHRAHLGAQQLAGQRGGRGLAVGAGDGDDVGLHHPPRQLELADDGHPAGAHRDERGQLERHPRAHHHQLRPDETRRRDGRPPRARSPGARARGPSAGSASSGLESEASTRPPRRRISRAAATPLLASPTTETVLPGERLPVRRAPLAVTAHEDPSGIRNVPSQRDRDGHSHVTSSGASAW